MIDGKTRSMQRQRELYFGRKLKVTNWLLDNNLIGSRARECLNWTRYVFARTFDSINSKINELEKLEIETTLRRNENTKKEHQTTFTKKCRKMPMSYDTL